VFENRVPRKTFGPKRLEVRGGWRKLHNEPHDCIPCNVIWVIKSWKMRWMGHVAHMAEKRGEMHTEFWLEILKKWNCLENLSLPSRTVLKWILKKQDGREWTGFIWLGIETSGRLLCTW
jgi:hypothetical protein